MRIVFLVLLLANAAAAAYFHWRHTGAQPAAAIMSQQIAPDRIRLVTAEEAERIAASRKAPTATVCFEWGAFSPADAVKAAEAVEALGGRASERRQEEAARWWVVVPPLATRNAAGTRAAEIRRQGIDDLYVIEDDAAGLRNGISLGLFRSEEGARARVEALAKRGVNGTRIVTRDAIVRVYLQVRDAPEALRGRVAELKAAWPATEVRDCPPEAKG